LELLVEGDFRLVPEWLLLLVERLLLAPMRLLLPVPVFLVGILRPP
jgi:hypothetical protein